MNKINKQHHICALMVAVTITLLCMFAQTAYADVTATPEASPDSNKAIGVAGNPDFYPYEYYDEESQTYKGVFPELLEMISETSGIDFVYIDAGDSDKRLRDSKMGEVEILSAYVSDTKEMENYRLQQGPVMISYDDGTTTEIGFVYTETMTEEDREAFENAAEQITNEDITSLMAKYAADRIVNNGISVLVFTVVIVLLLACVVTSLLFFMRWKRMMAKSQKDAITDELTGIGNRAYFEWKFRRLVAFQYKALYAVAYIAFDIKRVNEYYGAEAAEDQLKFAAKQLSETSVATDILARITGGGFAFAHVCSMEDDARNWIDSLLQSLNSYCEKYDNDYKPVFNAGIYCLGVGEWDCPAILDQVQHSWRQAVQESRPYVLLDSGTVRDMRIRRQLQHQTGDAIKENDILLYLQPVVYAEDGSVAFAEALSRWKHPTKGLLSPVRFVEIMEEVGAIIHLDFYIFEQTCLHEAKWQAKGEKIGISCNFTRATLSVRDFKERMDQIVQKYQFEHSGVIIEVTEDCLEKNKAEVRANLQYCKDLGFWIALDDMGSGYTFFSDLKDYPLDIVKIDHSLIWNMKTEKDEILFRSLVHFCMELGLDVLCEGVENNAQLQIAKESGCKYIQGYYYYRVMPAEEFEERIIDMHVMER